MTLAAAAARRAFELRARMTEPNRFNAEDIYYQFATGELDKRREALAHWVQLFPNDQLAHYNFAGCLQLLGELNYSLAEARESVRLLPSATSYGLLMQDAILTGQLDEAKVAYQAAETRGFGSLQLHELREEIAFFENDLASMKTQWAWAVDKPISDHHLLYDRSIVLSFHGRYREYRDLSQQASELAFREHVPHDVSFYTVEGALREAGLSSRIKTVIRS